MRSPNFVRGNNRLMAVIEDTLIIKELISKTDSFVIIGHETSNIITCTYYFPHYGEYDRDRKICFLLLKCPWQMGHFKIYPFKLIPSRKIYLHELYHSFAYFATFVNVNFLGIR